MLLNQAENSWQRHETWSSAGSHACYLHHVTLGAVHVHCTSLGDTWLRVLAALCLLLVLVLLVLLLLRLLSLML